MGFKQNPVNYVWEICKNIPKRSVLNGRREIHMGYGFSWFKCKLIPPKKEMLIGIFVHQSCTILWSVTGKGKVFKGVPTSAYWGEGGIGRSKGGARDTLPIRPIGVQILSFSCSFRQKNWKITPIWELAPPSHDNPGSATGRGGGLPTSAYRGGLPTKGCAYFCLLGGSLSGGRALSGWGCAWMENPWRPLEQSVCILLECIFVDNTMDKMYGQYGDN